MERIPELDQQNEDHYFSERNKLKEIAIETADRDDLPENFVDRVAAHILLERISQNVHRNMISKYWQRNQKYLRKLESLEEPTSKKSVSYSVWVSKYKPIVKN